MAVMLGMAAILLFYYFTDPAISRFMPQCLFHRLTGLNCPGCGSQRFFHAMLHGDVTQAIGHNLLLVIAIPYLAILLITTLMPNRFPRLSRIIYSQMGIISAGAVIILWTIIRNIFSI